MTTAEFQELWDKAIAHPDAKVSTHRTGGMAIAEAIDVTVGRLTLTIYTMGYTVPVCDRGNSIQVNHKHLNGVQTEVDREWAHEAVGRWRTLYDRLYPDMMVYENAAKEVSGQ